TSSLFARLIEKSSSSIFGVALSSQIWTFLPPGTDTTTYPERKDITLEQLVTHHSGLPKKNMGNESFDTYDTLCNALFKVPPQGSPSCTDPEDCMGDPADYHYSNIAFVLLGRALEYRFGKTYEKLFADEIASVLGTQHM